MRRENIMGNIRPITKLYEKCVSEARAQFGLSQFEVDVLGFLHNHPGMDTAREVSELRMIPKANVSQAVDSLSKRGFLETRRDEKDRRLVHLILTDAAREAVEAILKDQQSFIGLLFSGFTEDEISAFTNMQQRIIENAIQGLKED